MPLLPAADQAIIDEIKLTGYLLSRVHLQGRTKSAFFERFGFSIDGWQLLRDALLEHVRTHEGRHVETTPFGDAWEVIGSLRSPDGRNPLVLVVWFIRVGETAPRLVTAYPAESS